MKGEKQKKKIGSSLGPSQVCVRTSMWVPKFTQVGPTLAPNPTSSLLNSAFKSSTSISYQKTSSN